LTELIAVVEKKDGPVAPEEIAEEADLSARKLTSTIQKLEDVNVVERLPSGEVQLAEPVDLEQATEAVIEQQEKHKAAKKERLEQMRAYADTTGCRREHLLRYFGDEFTGPCGNCDNCEAETYVDPGLGVQREVV
jgi:ATP-dependent DNA helicase RecQ